MASFEATRRVKSSISLLAGDRRTHAHTTRHLSNELILKKMTVFLFLSSRKLLYWLVWKSGVLPEILLKTMFSSETFYMYVR